MKDTHTKETNVSVLVARNGHAVIFQGHYHQALIVAREHISRFLDQPESTSMLVVPPLAAQALHCYAATPEMSRLQISQDLALSQEFTLVFHADRRIKYLSNHEALPKARLLKAENIDVVVTPKLAALVEGATNAAHLVTVVEMPHCERTDYPRRFAHDPQILRNAVFLAIAQRPSRAPV